MPPWPDARNDREERKPMDGRNGRETGTLSEAGRERECRARRGIAGALPANYRGSILYLRPLPCRSAARDGALIYTPIRGNVYTRIESNTFRRESSMKTIKKATPGKSAPMKTLAIISQKGGVGKTTIATALAVAAEMDGKSAAVFDLDPQASATFWHDTREAENPAVVSIAPARLQHVLKAAAESGCRLAIIDAPPFAKDIAYEAAQHADFILVPTRPAVLDVMAMTRTLELVRHYSKPSAVVLTFCPILGREITDTEDAIKQLKATLAPVRIHSRVAYSRAQQTGLTAQEFEPDGKAAEEIKQLYAYTCMHLYADTDEDAHGPQFAAIRSR